VNKAETLSRLEILLERVRVRAGARGGSAASSAPATTDTVDAAPVEEPVQLSTWTPPPPEAPAPDVAIAIDVDYVETAQVTRADSRSEDSHADRFDSTERLVVAGSADDAADELIPEPEPIENGEQAVETQPPTDAPVEEAVESEPAPASSRRPVMMTEPDDRLERIAFGAGDARPPLHTPPPESGRVPAAPADEFDSENPEARHLAEPLVAEATRAILESRGPVAELTGAPRRSVPTTFSALLDETLSL
jgi:hypothetical protein